MKVSLNNFWWVLGSALLPWTKLFADHHEGMASSGMTAAQLGAYLAPLGIGLGFGLAAALGAYSQGKIGAAFMEGVARNPGAKDAMFVPMILALALVETLVLFGFAVSFLMMTKIFG